MTRQSHLYEAHVLQLVLQTAAGLLASVAHTHLASFAPIHRIYSALERERELLVPFPFQVHLSDWYTL